MMRREAETPPHEVPVVRIFLSSPGDVDEERTLTRQLIDSELPKFPPFREKVKFELIAWDDPAARIPMLATETPQESVNVARPRPATCDIVIVILWSRMGTPLPDNLRKLNGEPYRSGTEWEYEDAVSSSQQSRRPQVLVYRRTEKPKVELGDPGLAEKLAQFQRVEAFFAQLRSLKRGINEYETPSEFKTRLSQHLQDILWRLLQHSGDNDGPPQTAPAIPLEYIEWLQRTCADVSLLGQDLHEGQAFTLNHVYVPALTRSVLEQKPVTLLQRLDQKSLYVTAPAGAGKSTFCRWAALQSLSSAEIAHLVPAPADFVEPVPTNLRGRLPLLVSLRDFWKSMDCGRGLQTWYQSNLEQALVAWVDALPPPGLNGDLLKAHLKDGTAFLLLDGLDEVPISEPHGGATDYPRELLLSGLANALPAWQEAGNRVLLTSRPYGLDEARLDRLGLQHAPLEPLPKPLQDLFVTRWFHALGKQPVIPALIETIRSRTELAPLVENPMLLTALCVLYGSGGQLPEDRHELYKRIVNNVLYNRFPGDTRQREPIKARLEAIALGMHTGSHRRSPAAEISYLEVELLLRKFTAEDSSYEYGRVAPAARREELLTRSGLLLPRPKERVSFYHLSIQEFLAAERLLRTTEDLEPVFRKRSAVAAWHLTLMFLFAGKIASKTPQWGSDLLGRLITKQDRSPVKANPAPAAFIAEVVDHFIAKKYPIPPALKENFRRFSLAAIEDEIDLPVRQTLGLCLGQVGDSRMLDLRDPSAYVEVPTSTCDEWRGRKTFEITAPFRIGRYPVTNSQYQAFIDEGGYRERRWWSEIGWTWLQREGVTEPNYWRNRRWNGPNQPVVGVSFWEAEACSTWAGGRLPQEEEWETAARGRNGYTYPWGNDWESRICNTHEAGLGVTSPVGLFPRARQARLGIEDLAGNVWEWCEGSLYDLSDSKGPNAPRVLHGGSWYHDQDYARSAARNMNNPDDRVNCIGFRVVCRVTHEAI